VVSLGRVDAGNAAGALLMAACLGLFGATVEPTKAALPADLVPGVRFESLVAESSVAAGVVRIREPASAAVQYADAGSFDCPSCWTSSLKVEKV
jgi:hypothetical protein